MTLDGLEQVINQAVRGKVRGKGLVKRNWHKVHLIRYADDFIVTADNPDILKDQIKPVIETFLAERGLLLSEEKTKITHIGEGFNFLGQNVRKYSNGILLIKPSKDSFLSIKTKIKDIVDMNKSTSPLELIAQLNPVIRGWCNYHRHIVSKDTFAKVDNYTFKLLWKWALRQHQKKNHTWIKEKYFKTIGNNNWVFAAINEKGNYTAICQASLIPIVRHVLIKGDANPYDESWATYFAQRKAGYRYPM
jgi:RNA-directed DNA polymerase